jgi:hypothetical protein
MNSRNTEPGAQGRLRAILAGRLRATRLALESFPADHPLAGNFRAEQLRAVLRLTPLTMLANLVNASLVCAAFWNSVNRRAFVHGTQGKAAPPPQRAPSAARPFTRRGWR